MLQGYRGECGRLALRQKKLQRIWGIHWSSTGNTGDNAVTDICGGHCGRASEDAGRDREMIENNLYSDNVQSESRLSHFGKAGVLAYIPCTEIVMTQSTEK